MKKNIAGSGIVLIVILLSLITLLTLGAWRSIGYFVDFSLTCQRNEMNYVKTTALMRWAIALVRANFKKIMQQCSSVPLEISLQSWPPDNAYGSPAKLIFTMQGEDALRIKASVNDGVGQDYIIESVLAKNIGQEKKGICITEWHVGEK